MDPAQLGPLRRMSFGGNIRFPKHRAAHPDNELYQTSCSHEFTQLFNKFSGFYGTRRFIDVFIGRRHETLASFIQPHPLTLTRISYRSILILSRHLRLGLLSGPSLHLFLPEIRMYLSSPPYVLHVSSSLSTSNLSPKYLVTS